MFYKKPIYISAIKNVNEILMRDFPKETKVISDFNKIVRRNEVDKLIESNVRCDICSSLGERITCLGCKKNHKLCNSCWIKMNPYKHDNHFLKEEDDDF